MRSPEIGTFNSKPEIEQEPVSKISMSREDIAAYVRTAYAKDLDNVDIIETIYLELEERLDVASFAVAQDVIFNLMVYCAGNKRFEEIV
ncbi:hypothetical protein IPM09_02085 [Candidatus Saccharibacteria bacterium]|nr:MAG: hypothetical protein IPM09_02085 [Candidatus Saccharibacteria bacterium]